MRICTQGLWHLGSVTAGCMASMGHDVTGLDFDQQSVDKLCKAITPVSEPGLDELIRTGSNAGNLRFTSQVDVGVTDARVLWVTYDTPVDDNDQADVDFVFEEVTKVLPFLASDTIVLVSAQLPVGSIRRFENIAAEKCPEKHLHFACSPENLRLGHALKVFLHPERVVIGTRHQEDREILGRLFEGITDNILWMGVESADIGADAGEVGTGLKSEARIGPGAYLSPGAAFAGGTLARDIEFLNDIGSANNIFNPLIAAVKISNGAHKKWVERRLESVLGTLKGKKIAVWGLTYKANTSTLRRSLSVEICNWLMIKGAQITVHDPSNCELPDSWHEKVVRSDTPLEALSGVCALVVATEWPEYREISVEDVENIAGQLTIFDSNGFIRDFQKSPAVSYFSVGVGP